MTLMDITPMRAVTGRRITGNKNIITQDIHGNMPLKAADRFPDILSVYIIYKGDFPCLISGKELKNSYRM